MSKQAEAHVELWYRIRDRLMSEPPAPLADVRSTLAELQHMSAEPTGVTYEDVDVAGVRGKWCIPVDADTDHAVIYLHGGGYVFGSAAQSRKVVGHLAKAANVRALALDYRLAPENRHPAQVEDALAAFHWLREQGVDADRIAFAGDSAGGCLAVTAALRLLRDGGAVPGAVVSISGWLDPALEGSTLDTNAEHDLAVSRESLTGCLTMWLGEDYLQHVKDPSLNPLHADLTGFPPVYLTASTAETLYDASERFAASAREAGVDVAFDTVDELQHVWTDLAGLAPEADESIARISSFLRTHLTG